MRTYSCTLSNGVANAAQQHATQNNNNENNNNNSNPQKLASRASAPEPATHQRPTLVRQWSEASGQMIALGGGKGVSRCFSELLPRPPSTRMLTQMLDAMTQDMDGMCDYCAILLHACTVINNRHHHTHPPRPHHGHVGQCDRGYANRAPHT